MRYQIDLEGERLLSAGKPVSVTNKAFKLLCLLASNRGRLVTKDKITRSLWPKLHVSDGLVKGYVRDLRLALGDDPTRPKFIETARGRGYRFVGDIEFVNAPRHVAHADGVAPVTQAVGRNAAALPSVVILPFASSDGSKSMRYFERGIIEDIIVSLASLKELSVISHTAALALDEEPTDLGRLQSEYGIEYALLGNITYLGPKLKIVVSLIETKSGTVLFGDRFILKREEIFHFQDEVVMHIVNGIVPAVESSSLRRALRMRPANYTVYDNVLRALYIFREVNRETFPLALDYLHAAIAKDPAFANAHAWAARWHSVQIGQGWSACRAEDARQAETLAKRAIGLDMQNALALATYGHIRSFIFHDCENARSFLKQAREVCPSSAHAWIVSSATESYLGNADDAIAMAERGLQLSPAGRELYFYYNFAAMAYTVARRYEEAWIYANKSFIEHPYFTSNLRSSIHILSALGRIDEARKMTERMMKLEPEFDLGDYERTRLPFKLSDYRQQMIGHLRKAGAPG